MTEYVMKKGFLKLFGAKTRNEIRNGKLWEITKLWGFDLVKTEVEPAKPEAFKKPEESAPVDKMRVHIIKGENNVTNLTKDADFL